MKSSHWDMEPTSQNVYEPNIQILYKNIVASIRK